MPWLDLKGISTGDFSEALQAILGGADGLSPNVIVRLKEKWSAEYEAWIRRDLSGKQFVYYWADGIHVNVRLEETENQRQCMLALMAATADGRNELLAVVDGYCESEQSWYELLIGLRQRGLELAPKLATGDGALGFWAALRKVYPETREQRCWMHKTANVLNKMPKSVQPRAKTDLHEIWMSATRADGSKAFDAFALIDQSCRPFVDKSVGHTVNFRCTAQARLRNPASAIARDQTQHDFAMIARRRIRRHFGSVAYDPALAR